MFAKIITMEVFFASFTNRDKALLIWILVIFIYFLYDKNLRKLLSTIIIQLFTTIITLWLILMFMYISFFCYVLSRLGYWDVSLLKDTIFWFFGTAFIMFVNISQASNDKNFFKNAVLANLRFTVLIDFVINLYVFNFVIEFLMLPILVLLAGMITVLPNMKNSASTLKFLNIVLSFFGIYLLIYAISHLFNNFSSFSFIENLKDFLLPLLLTFGFLPYIYFLALCILYSSVFSRIQGFTLKKKDNHYVAFTKWIIFKTCLFNLVELRRFLTNYSLKLTYINSKLELISLVHEFKSKSKV